MKATRTMMALTAVLLGGSGCGLLLDLDPADPDGGTSDAAALRDGGTRRDGGPIDGGRLDGGRLDGGRVDGGRVDGGRMDASAGDAGNNAGLDGALDDGGDPGADAGPDAGHDAGASCRPELVEFPMGGSLVIGTLCDEIVVCASEGDVEAVRAAAPSFFCDASAMVPLCDERTSCLADPADNVLDATLIAEICALTQLTPPPQIVCRVFL